MPKETKQKPKITEDEYSECGLCSAIVGNTELQARYLPEYQAVQNICNTCRADHVTWNPNDAIPDGDAQV